MTDPIAAQYRDYLHHFKHGPVSALDLDDNHSGPINALISAGYLQLVMQTEEVYITEDGIRYLAATDQADTTPATVAATYDWWANADPEATQRVFADHATAVAVLYQAHHEPPAGHRGFERGECSIRDLATGTVMDVTDFLHIHTGDWSDDDQDDEDQAVEEPSDPTDDELRAYLTRFARGPLPLAEVGREEDSRPSDILSGCGFLVVDGDQVHLTPHGAAWLGITPPRDDEPPAEPPVEAELPAPAERPLSEAPRKAAPDPAPAPVPGAPSPVAVLPNTWGSYISGSPIDYHDDGPTGTAVKYMGADALMDVDGEPLVNVVGRMATDVVHGRRTPAEYGADLAALVDRLPADSAARRCLSTALRDLQAPETPCPTLPDTTPEPLRTLVAELHAIPLVRNDPGPDLTKVLDLIDRHAAGKVRAAFLDDEVRRLRNCRHESMGDVGKFAVDRAVERALEALRRR